MTRPTEEEVRRLKSFLGDTYQEKREELRHTYKAEAKKIGQDNKESEEFKELAIRAEKINSDISEFCKDCAVSKIAYLPYNSCSETNLVCVQPINPNWDMIPSGKLASDKLQKSYRDSLKAIITSGLQEMKDVLDDFDKE